MSVLERNPAGRLAPPPVPPPDRGELFVLWSAAQAEANLAYDAWSVTPGTRAYAAFRAAEDRADAAQDALARGFC